MRAFLTFLALILVCLLVGVALAYPVWLLAQSWDVSWPIHRIANRIAELLLLVGLFWMLKWFGAANPGDLGYGLPRAQFFKQLFTALAIGVVSMAPVIGLLYALGIRVNRPDVVLQAGMLAGILGQGLMTGLAVALIEETILRGMLFSAIERESGKVAAVSLTAVLYAAAHFLGSVRIAHADVRWDSGIDLLRGTLGAFGEPGRIVDSFLALLAVGVLLALVRIRTGAIAACIGLHAGWVWLIVATREISVKNDAADLGFLVGLYDGVTGYLVFGWTVLICLAFWYGGVLRRIPATA